MCVGVWRAWTWRVFGTREGEKEGVCLKREENLYVRFFVRHEINHGAVQTTSLLRRKVKPDSKRNPTTRQSLI
jgi:hypothetical protein